MAQRIIFIITPYKDYPKDIADKQLSTAAKKAGFIPYMPPGDPTAGNLHDAITSKIRDSVVCIAEISFPNPNVWFEVGYAMSIDKPIVFVCENSAWKEKGLPFDIVHQAVEWYDRNSPKDLSSLVRRVQIRIEGRLSHVSARVSERFRELQTSLSKELHTLCNLIAFPQKASEKGLRASIRIYSKTKECVYPFAAWYPPGMTDGYVTIKDTELNRQNFLILQALHGRGPLARNVPNIDYGSEFTGRIRANINACVAIPLFDEILGQKVAPLGVLSIDSDLSVEELRLGEGHGLMMLRAFSDAMYKRLNDINVGGALTGYLEGRYGTDPRT